jgi:hypothetical protein
MATITIDGKEYDAEALSDEAKSQLVSLQFCDVELQRLQAEAASFQTARMQYARALQEELQKHENSTKAPSSSSGNGKDNTQADPEKKKGLKGFFSKK